MARKRVIGKSNKKKTYELESCPECGSKLFYWKKQGKNEIAVCKKCGYKDKDSNTGY